MGLLGEVGCGEAAMAIKALVQSPVAVQFDHVAGAGRPMQVVDVLGDHHYPSDVLLQTSNGPVPCIGLNPADAAIMGIVDRIDL